MASTRVPSEEDWKKLSKLIDQFYNNRPDAGNKNIYILYYNHYEGWRCFVLVDCGRGGGGGKNYTVFIQTYSIGCVCVFCQSVFSLVFFPYMLVSCCWKNHFEHRSNGKHWVSSERMATHCFGKNGGDERPCQQTTTTTMPLLLVLQLSICKFLYSLLLIMIIFYIYVIHQVCLIIRKL